jgi:hypothetical protein
MAWNWTAQSWRTFSEQGKFWRTSSFNRIETAVGRYNKHAADPNERLRQLKAILDAISEWRVAKQEKKGKEQHFASPRTARDTGDKIAAKEIKLAEVGVIAGDATLSVRSAATDRLVADVASEIDAALALARAAWGNDFFTDPAEHDGADFRYLVSAQSESRQIVAHRELTIQNPALIADALISATVITDASVHMWGPSGFILAVPTSCIGAAAAGDVAARNAVAEGHVLEKYREILRLYLGGGGIAGIGLPPPTAMRRPSGHNEVVVLGRSYGQVTSVAGIYVIVDEVADDVAGIRPARVGRVLANLIRRGTTTVTKVVEKLPAVTDRRMGQFLALNRDRGLPIVQIPVSAAVEVNNAYWANVYEGERFDFPVPATAVEHGSREHLALVAQRDQYLPPTFFNHANCPVCQPRG